jgi:hypothetical protein
LLPTFADFGTVTSRACGGTSRIFMKIPARPPRLVDCSDLDGKIFGTDAHERSELPRAGQRPDPEQGLLVDG